jgi:DNA-directed RNA polymerase sigma subunit (sigma70/sigma32)
MRRRETRVLFLRYFQEPRITRKEVGLEFGVTPNRIAQIEKKALRILRAPWRYREFIKSNAPLRLKQAVNPEYDSNE